MNRPRSPLALLLLVGAIVCYFLPWFEWSCVSTVAYSAEFQHGLRGLPDDMKPRDRYEQRQRLAPAGVALGWADITTESDATGAMDGFTIIAPALRFGPRYGPTSRLGYAVGGGLLLLALYGCWRHRGLALLGCLGASSAILVAVGADPHLGKYLAGSDDQRAIELPGQFRLEYALHYGTVGWCWCALTCLVLATVAVLFGRKKGPHGDTRRGFG